MIKQLNPSWDVVSIGFEKHKNNLLKDSILVDINKYPNNDKVCEVRAGYGAEWVMGDSFLYEAYNQLPNYDKYFLIEYDTICNCSIESFFSNINTDNHFGRNTFKNLKRNMIFYQIYKKNNPYN
jgi:hypothetical protein